MAEQWLSIVEYARTYSVSDMTVRRRIKTGKLHAVLKEGKYYIPVPVDGGSTSRPAAREQSTTSGRGSGRDATPRRAEISVVKSHPLAQKTYSGVIAAQENPQTPANGFGPLFDDGDAGQSNSATSVLAADSPIPNSLRTAVEQRSTTIVDSRALLAFCDGSLRSSGAAERRVEDLYRTRMEAMAQQLKNKDLELNSLKQQLEDLHLLVQILEKKRG